MTDIIDAKQARLELGDDAYFNLHRWLVEKGYRNLNGVFITRAQLNEYIHEQVKELRGGSDQPIGVLWGQTREHIKGKKK